MVVDPGGSNGPGPDGGSYRDEKMDLKRQAQRFRIYGYDAQGSVVGEVDAGSADVAEISWRVHVRNMKAANYAFQGAYLFDPAKYRNPDIEGDAASPVDRKKLIIDPGPQVISSRNALPVHMKGDIFSGITEGMLPGYLRYCNFTPEDPSQPVTVRYTAARDIELGQLYLDHKKRLIFVAASGKSDCVTTPKVQLSNPSLIFNPPNGPDNGEDPLTNQFAYFNVPGWWDDTCGGEIDATVKLANGIVLSTRDGVENIGDNGTRNAKNGAWVVTAPPKYSPYMYHVVSILDRVYEAFPQAAPNYKKKTNFYRDVYPILSRASNYAWVSTAAAGVEPGTRKLAHGPAQAGNFLSPEKLAILANPGIEASPARKAVFAIMRHAEGGKLLNTLPPKSPPAPAPRPRPLGEGPISNGVEMPKLWGTGGKPVQNRQMENNLANQYLSLTDWQLARMQDWADGHFEVGELLKPVPLEQLPVAEQPLALDEAALEPTIGGGFHPGIEFPYLIAYPTNFAEAFRVKEGTEPGSIAAYMSSPWQGDYWSCNSGWWPVQRPDIVFKYDKSTGERTYREWFRGFGPHGEPLSSTDGYQQMVYAWSKLGMVLPEKDIATGDFIEADGQLVFQEFERDPALNTPPKSKDSC